jgi:Fe-S cluster biogenesis protein NfuA
MKMKDKEIIEKIKILIDKLRPFLLNDGGNIEFVKYENGIVYVKLSGACENCPMMDVTLNDGVEQLIMSEIPEVKAVKTIEDNN